MIGFNTLRSTKAEPIDALSYLTKTNLQYYFTSYGTFDEKQICNALNKRLKKLEGSLDLNKVELNSIKENAEEILLLIDDKQQLQLRINYLERLYETKKLIDDQSIRSKEEAERLRTRIAPANISLLKNQIRSELDGLIKSLPSRELEQIKPSVEEKLMKNATEEIGDIFNDLGEEVRNAIISKIFNDYGDKATVDKVKDLTISIQQNVNDLKSIKEPNKLVKLLEGLPYVLSFSELTLERKQEIATKLIEKNEWNGLASLNRMIILLDKTLTIRERKEKKAQNRIQINEGKNAFTLHLTVDNELVNIG